jgi:putative alpha-1,2-mannosidase
MRVALRRLLAVSMMAAGLIGGTGITAPTAGALGWGAIAISPDTGKAGYSQGFNSATEAEQAAVGLCKARDCRAVVNFTKACGAVAQAPNASWAWGWDYSSPGAQKKALISCSQYGPGCRVVGWICS